MISRRQHKIARAIRESVSKTILNGLSDPRINGLVTVTEVDVSPDMKNATVFLSVLTPDDRKADVTFDAICHAIGHFQHQLGGDLTGRLCPHLRFEKDRKVSKTLETLRLIEQAGQEYSEHPVQELGDDSENPKE
jgi:ribosome-binding factor A